MDSTASSWEREGSYPLLRLDGEFVAAFGPLSPHRSRFRRAAFWSVQWSAMVLTMLASARAYVMPEFGLSARSAVAIAFSSAFLVVAPFLVLRHERRARDLLERLGPDLSGPKFADAVATYRRCEPFIRGLVPIPIVLALWAYWSNSEFFGSQFGLGRPPEFFALIGAGVLSLGGLSAGTGVSSAIRSVVLCVVLARVPDDWEPFTESASANAELLATHANTSSSYFSISGALLLPGVVVIASDVGGAGLAAMLAIALLIGSIAAATLIVPAWAIHRGSALDKAEFVRRLSDQILPLAEEWMSADWNQEDDSGRSYYRLRSLLEIRQQVVSQPSSPAAMRLLQRVPGSVIAPVIAILLR